MQNATYASKMSEALQYCDKSVLLAADDTFVLNEIGFVYFHNAKYKEAEPLFQRSLKIFESSFDTDHPNVARGLNNLAGLMLATNRLDEAGPLCRRAVRIFEVSLGLEHPTTLRAKKNLGIFLDKYSEWKKED